MTENAPEDQWPVAILCDGDGCLTSTGGSGTKAWRHTFDRLHGIPADIGEFTDRTGDARPAPHVPDRTIRPTSEDKP